MMELAEHKCTRCKATWKSNTRTDCPQCGHDGRDDKIAELESEIANLKISLMCAAGAMTGLAGRETQHPEVVFDELIAYGQNWK
jgi:hypothetical protein